MPPTVTKFLGKAELQYLLTQLKTQMSATVAGDIINTTVPNSSSTDNDVPSSLAVYTLIEGTKTKVEYVTGPMAAVTPEDNTLYVQRDDAADTTWSLYLYDGTAWILVGGGVPDNVWEESELEVMTNADIDEVFAVVWP